MQQLEYIVHLDGVPIKSVAPLSVNVEALESEYYMRRGNNFYFRNEFRSWYITVSDNEMVLMKDLKYGAMVTVDCELQP